MGVFFDLGNILVFKRNSKPEMGENARDEKMGTERYHCRKSRKYWDLYRRMDQGIEGVRWDGGNYWL